MREKVVLKYEVEMLSVRPSPQLSATLLPPQPLTVHPKVIATGSGVGPERGETLNEMLLVGEGVSATHDGALVHPSAPTEPATRCVPDAQIGGV